MSRSILHGVGAAQDPDVVDYYNKACMFLIVYSAGQDPEVIDEMKITAAKLKDGGDRGELEDATSGDEMSEESDEGDAANWVDEDEQEQSKKKKVFLSVDTVPTATSRCVSWWRRLFFLRL
jgi:hypothetical protein